MPVGYFILIIQKCQYLLLQRHGICVLHFVWLTGGSNVYKTAQKPA